MLRRRHQRLGLGVLAALLIAAAAVFAPNLSSPVFALGTGGQDDNGGGLDASSSDTHDGTPADGAQGDAGAASDGVSPHGFRPAAEVCVWDNTVTRIWANELLPDYRHPPVTLDSCTDADGGHWQTDGDCAQGYVGVAPDQKAPPEGESASVGAWYECMPFCPITDTLIIGEGIPAGCMAHDYWSNVPPAGIDTYTPAQAAAALIATIHLNPVSIGMAPAAKVHADDPAGTAAYRRTWVGIPVWLWVDHPGTGNQFGTLNFRKTIGGLDVSATAVADNVEYTSGDGQTIHCATGTPFDEAAMAGKPAADSPTCGFRYQHTSAGQPGGVFTVTATTVWSIHWTAGDDAGTVNRGATTSSATVRVGQLESVNVPLTADDLAWAMSH
jgi:hypothetical protein